MSCFHRSYGHIPPYSHPSSFSQVPETFPKRNCLPIPGSFICDFKSVLCFYKPDGDCGRTYLISAAQHSPVLRRLAYPSSVPGVSPVRPVTVKGNQYKPRSNTKSSEIRPSSFSGLQFLGMRCPTHLGIVRVLEESQQNSSPVFFRVLQVQFITVREFLSMLGSLNAAADFHLGRLHMRPLQFHLLANRKPHRDSLDLSIPMSYSCRASINMVDESYHLLDRDSPSYSISRFLSVLRRQSLGLGCSFGTLRPRSQPLGICFPRPSYQQFGDTSSFPSTPTFSESHLRLLRDGSVRKFVRSGLPQETRGAHSSSLCTLVWELLYWCHHRYSHSSRKFPGKLNVSGQSVSSRPNSPY